MVFNNDYDNSLWLMICGDIFNREKIRMVIKNIPFELLEQIQSGIREYNVDNISKNIDYERGNLRYLVSINCSELSIKMIRELEHETEEIELFLLPHSKECISKMRLNEALCLGGFTNTTYYDCMKFGTTLDEYEMIKTITGNYVKLYTDNSVRCLCRNKVRVRRMPDSFNVHQIRTDKSIKKLVRGRNKYQK